MTILATHKTLPDTNINGHPANTISVSAISGLSSNTVQSVIEEINTNKFDSSGGTVSGDMVVTGNVTIQGITTSTITFYSLDGGFSDSTYGGVTPLNCGGA